MLLFFKHLLLMLDDVRPGWRTSHVIMLDNATYHKSPTMLKFFEEFSVPVIFTGSYCYDAAPAEPLFAAFKSADINPRRLP